VKIGCNERYFNSEKTIKDHFRAKLRVAPEISFSSPAEIYRIQMPAKNRKPVIFVDHRNH
jgi:phenylacetate-CoA ligase